MGGTPGATPTPLRLGLTGGIGSGKSTVAGLLVGLGAALVDTDAIARSLTAPGGAAIAALAEAFGPQILTPDGAMDRDAMRRHVFGDTQARQRLEGILHPMIGAEAARQATAAAAAAAPVVLFDVPLLTESAHWRARVDKILVIDCLEATQVARVAQRPGWDAATAERVLAQQATRAARRAIADAVLFNDGLALPALAAQVRTLWQTWVATAPAGDTFAAAAPAH